MSSQV
jgi:hypothetical protein